MPLSEHVVEDYVATGLSLKEHPVRFFRDHLTALGALPNAQASGATIYVRMRVSPSPALCWCGSGRARRKA